MPNTINTDLFEVSYTFHFPSNIKMQYFDNGSAFSPCESNWHSITLSQCISVVKSLYCTLSTLYRILVVVSGVRMTIHSPLNVVPLWLDIAEKRSKRGTEFDYSCLPQWEG